jgi:RNA polymerase sigma-70 factor (ECF subfamily)
VTTQGWTTDGADFERALAGDRAALEDLWQEHRRWVAVVLLAHKPREADVDDLLQDVARVLVARIGEVRDPGAFKPWLRTVAINLARTSGRRMRPNSWWTAAAHNRDGLGERERRDGAAGAAAMEEGRRLLALAEQLDEGYREPLLLKAIRGMSYRQIGELLGLPETTVETRIARGRRMLRELAAVEQARAEHDGVHASKAMEGRGS